MVTPDGSCYEAIKRYIGTCASVGIAASYLVTPAKLPLKNFHLHGVIIAIKCGCTVPSRAVIMYMNGQLKGHLWTPQLQTAWISM